MNEFRLKVNTSKWNRQHKDFQSYYTNRQWEEAILAAKNTLSTGPVDEELYRKLANSYVKVNNDMKAKKHMKTALELRAGVSKKELMQLVETTTFSQSLAVDSQFTYPGGGDNVGFIQHLVETERGTEKYLTKIVPTDYPLDHFAKKEQYFHKVVRPQSAKLTQVTPEMLASLERKEDRLLLMTFPKLANDGISCEHLQDILQINKKINQSLQVDEIKDILQMTDRGKAAHLSSLMHRRSTHLLIFQNMRKKIHPLQQREELQRQITRFERLILTLELYREINPATDYVFTHGDFNGNNILYNKKEDKYYVIDWSSYGLGLRGQDAAKLFASCRMPFKEIMESYIDLIFEEDEKIVLNKVFFVYWLLILWIERLDLENIEKQLTDDITPGADYIEQLLKQNGYHL